MRYSFQLLNDTVPEPVPAGHFESEGEMKREALKYLLEVARDKSPEFPCRLELVARDEKGGVCALTLSITDAKTN
jgi:hypothetical protein